MTHGSGSTKPDSNNPYMLKFQDTNGNTIYRPMGRPAVLDTYYDSCGLIDNHNHLRQGNLAYERKWTTQNCWFRFFSTLVGIQVVDSFNLLNILCQTYKNKEYSIVQHAEVLGTELVEMAEEIELQLKEAEVAAVLTVKFNTQGNAVDEFEPTCVPTRFPWVDKPDSSSSKRYRQAQHCVWCWATQKTKRCTTWHCPKCNVALCRNGTGNNSATKRFCWTEYHNHMEDED